MSGRNSDGNLNRNLQNQGSDSSAGFGRGGGRGRGRGGPDYSQRQYMSFSEYNAWRQRQHQPENPSGGRGRGSALGPMGQRHTLFVPSEANTMPNVVTNQRDLTVPEMMQLPSLRESLPNYGLNNTGTSNNMRQNEISQSVNRLPDIPNANFEQNPQNLTLPAIHTPSYTWDGYAPLTPESPAGGTYLKGWMETRRDLEQQQQNLRAQQINAQRQQYTRQLEQPLSTTENLSGKRVVSSQKQYDDASRRKDVTFEVPSHLKPTITQHRETMRNAWPAFRNGLEPSNYQQRAEDLSKALQSCSQGITDNSSYEREYSSALKSFSSAIKEYGKIVRKNDKTKAGEKKAKQSMKKLGKAQEKFARLLEKNRNRDDSQDSNQSHNDVPPPTESSRDVRQNQNEQLLQRDTVIGEVNEAIASFARIQSQQQSLQNRYRQAPYQQDTQPTLNQYNIRQTERQDTWPPLHQQLNDFQQPTLNQYNIRQTERQDTWPPLHQQQQLNDLPQEGIVVSEEEMRQQQQWIEERNRVFQRDLDRNRDRRY